MKYRLSCLIVLLLVLSSCSPQGTTNDAAISLGMSHESALKIIRECGGQDITSQLQIVGPNGESPRSGLYWSLEQYNSVVEIAAENGNVVLIDYWTGADFSESKSHRAESRRSLKSLTFDKRTRTVKTEAL